MNKLELLLCYALLICLPFVVILDISGIVFNYINSSKHFNFKLFRSSTNPTFYVRYKMDGNVYGELILFG